MMKNRAGWLALIVLAIASLLMIFFVLPRIGQDAKPLGDAINAAGNAVKDAVNDDKQALKPTETPKTGDQAAVAPPKADAPQAAAPQAASPEPAAPQTTPKTGQLAPAAKAAVTPSFDVLRVEPDGSAVIAGRADPHSTLEVTDGTSTVAKTDVGPSGDFVAILDKPLPPGDHQLVLKATSKDGKATVSEEIATVSVPDDKKTGKLLAMVTTPGKASRLIATPEAQKPANATAAANGTAPNLSDASKPVATPPLPQNSTEIATTAPNVVAATAAPAAPNAAAAPVASGVNPALQITAVELEGNKIFIAGISKSGTTVRGIADGKPVGQSRAGSDGHFVIEGVLDLTVGDHRISVEALNNAGQPQLRVEVPFNRPVGDQVAAVASPAISSPTAAIDGGAFDKLRNDTVRAFNILQGLYAGGKLPSMEQLAAARSSTGIALKSITEYRLPADASVAARSLADNAVKDAATALAALNALPNDVASVGEGLKEIAEMIARVVGPAIGQQLNNPDVAAATAPAGNTQTAGNGATTIQQAPLTQSARSSVIIRQGDTLWQISRRVYGQGVRYTTIYLANEDQIRNPDVIQPGQIFGVPEEFRPDSEELHRERLMHRRS
jgi:nucleoid-associated protein YgaU